MCTLHFLTSSHPSSLPPSFPPMQGSAVPRSPSPALQERSALMKGALSSAAAAKGKLGSTSFAPPAKAAVPSAAHLPAGRPPVATGIPQFFVSQKAGGPAALQPKAGGPTALQPKAALSAFGRSNGVGRGTGGGASGNGGGGAGGSAMLQVRRDAGTQQHPSGAQQRPPEEKAKFPVGAAPIGGGGGAPAGVDGGAPVAAEPPSGSFRPRSGWASQRVSAPLPAA